MEKIYSIPIKLEKTGESEKNIFFPVSVNQWVFYTYNCVFVFLTNSVYVGFRKF